MQPPFTNRKLPGLALLIPGLVFLTWEIAVSINWIDPVFFPPPSALWRMAYKLVVSGDLPRALMATVSRATLGFIPGAIAGVALGILTGISPTARRMLEPSISSLYSMPKLALLPIFFLILGAGEMARFALIALGTFLAMTMQVFDGVCSIDRGYVEMARNYGATPWQLLRKVYLPATLPHIFTGSRITFGRALVIAISVELVTGSTGLGSMIWLAWQTFSTERLYVGVCAAGLLGVTTQTALRAAERRLTPWRQV